MGELRKDYVLERYVIIASERAKRPDQFASPANAQLPEHVSTGCYFCPGNENLTPPECQRFPDKGDWEIRVFPNKFPAVKPEGKSAIATDNTFFTYSDAFGYHEVIVETPVHDMILADLPPERIANLFEVIRKRIEENLYRPGIKYVTVFKNHGEKAGTSIVHTHCQLIATNLVPKIIQDKEDAAQRYSSCPYCSVIAIERNSYRKCYENGRFIAFTPYASRFPFEIWMLPKRHAMTLAQLSQDEICDLAEILKKILLKLKSLNANYNLYLQEGIKNMHFHIEITPRISTHAGFELGTGIIINTMPPENAAEFYRN